MWKKEIDKNEALLAYRTTRLESGNRPDEVLFNRRIRNGLPLQHEVLPDLSGFREHDV